MNFLLSLLLPNQLNTYKGASQACNPFNRIPVFNSGGRTSERFLFF